ncbi:MAG: RNA polymerase factor sigma-54 [Anaerolineae bacterium]|nr:RNA polymerase factor sigma-54 [Anaerolineae bacterium]
MKLHQVIAQRPTVTPQLVMARTLLQLSSTELEQAIAHELAENPALELVETPGGEAPCCPKCGRPLRNAACPVCGRSSSREYDTLEYGGADARDDDGTSQLSSHTTLAEHLLRQARLSLPSQDAPIAAHLVESLDDHGFLRCDVDAVASQFGTDRAHVENVISAIQESGPAGIAARDARECLLIQLEHLRSQGIEHPLARALIDDHWEALSGQPLAKVAHAAGASAEQIRAALEFIRDNLNPFPAHANWAAHHESPPQKEAVYPQADVIIRGGADSPDRNREKYEIELPGARSYRLQVSPSFREVMETGKAGKIAFTEKDVEEWKAFYARAQLFIKGVERRWQTLERVARRLVDQQRDFLARGPKHLKPLTRAQLADMLAVHESTVSRAVAGKYVQLPSGRIIPLARFFDSAAPAKEALRELIAHESQPLSDRELVELLARQGHHVARRTVAKYREALHIPPSSARRRNRQLAREQSDTQTQSTNTQSTDTQSTDTQSTDTQSTDT